MKTIKLVLMTALVGLTSLVQAMDSSALSALLEQANKAVEDETIYWSGYGQAAVADAQALHARLAAQAAEIGQLTSSIGRLETAACESSARIAQLTAALAESQALAGTLQDQVGSKETIIGELQAEKERLNNLTVRLGEMIQRLMRLAVMAREQGEKVAEAIKHQAADQA